MKNLLRRLPASDFLQLLMPYLPCSLSPERSFPLLRVGELIFSTVSLFHATSQPPNILFVPLMFPSPPSILDVLLASSPLLNFLFHSPPFIFLQTTFFPFFLLLFLSLYRFLALPDVLGGQ